MKPPAISITKQNINTDKKLISARTACSYHDRIRDKLSYLGLFDKWLNWSSCWETITLELIFYDWVLYLIARSNNEKTGVEMKRKQQTYIHVVKTMWNKANSRKERKTTTLKSCWCARHDVTGSDLYHLQPYMSLAVPLTRLPAGDCVITQRLMTKHLV